MLPYFIRPAQGSPSCNALQMHRPVTNETPGSIQRERPASSLVQVACLSRKLQLNPSNFRFVLLPSS